MGISSIGPNKVDQARHVKFLQDGDGINALMGEHAKLLQPRFKAVIDGLQNELADSGICEWTNPEGGYFISFDTLPGLAKTVVGMAADAGVKLTPAGATFPYGRDPEDKNIRIAPSVPTVDEITKATEVFVNCVKLATINKLLAD